MIRRPPRSTLSSSSAASDVYKRQATLDGRHDLELTEARMAGVGSAPCGSTAAEDSRDLQNWTRHQSRALRGRRGHLVLPDQPIERAHDLADRPGGHLGVERLSLIHISEPTRLLSISYAVFC